jgi:hypothetical protein
MSLLLLILLIGALVCFGVEWFRSGFRSLLALGLALWALVLVIERWPG